jgi:hypothetical protein
VIRDHLNYTANSTTLTDTIQMKAKLRNEANRSVHALWQALGRIANAITPTQCANYFRHCGYSHSD